MSCGWRQVGWNQQVQHLPHLPGRRHRELRWARAIRQRPCSASPSPEGLVHRLFDRAGVDPGNWVLQDTPATAGSSRSTRTSPEPATRHGALRLVSDCSPTTRTAPMPSGSGCAWPCTQATCSLIPIPSWGRRPSMSAGYWTARYCATACVPPRSRWRCWSRQRSTRAWYGVPMAAWTPQPGIRWSLTGRRGRRTPGFTCRGRGRSQQRLATGTAPAPYLGLASFQPTDAERFFGRERLVNDL